MFTNRLNRKPKTPSEAKTAGDSSPVVFMENLSFSYDGPPVLEDVSLAISKGDFVSIVGPNGGGKSTLLKLVLGLIYPGQGTVRVFGLPPALARNRIGYVPQHAHLDLQFPVSVMDVVLMGRLGHRRTFGPYRSSDKDQAEAVLRELGLDRDYAHRHFSALSGGQRQRVLIARALVSDPDLLLLDEPTANLDVVSEHELYELLRLLNRRLSIVLVSHDLSFVSKYVHYVVYVKRTVRMRSASTLTHEAAHEILESEHRSVHHNPRHPGKGAP